MPETIATALLGIPVAEMLLASDTSAWVALLVLLALMAVPLGPAEPTAILAGLLVGAGMAPIWVVVLVLALGMTAGDLIAFRAGGPVQRRLARRPRAEAYLAAWRHHLHQRRLWRDAAVAGLRFIPGVRTPSALAARSTGIGTLRFGLLAAAGSVAWAAAWVGILGAAAARPGGLVVVGALLVLTVVAGLIWRRRGRGAAGSERRAP
ncbi:MAG TPA: VTT domain-containing protein [Beutenbergiaceae bacterium]|nr:VTT domain-containing protein [Beutenbergiaceae bacterium]